MVLVVVELVVGDGSSDNSDGSSSNINSSM